MPIYKHVQWIFLIKWSSLYKKPAVTSKNEEHSILCSKLRDSSPRTMEHNFSYNVSVSALSFFHRYGDAQMHLVNFILIFIIVIWFYALHSAAVGNKRESEMQEFSSKLRKERNMQNHVLEITPLIHLSSMSLNLNIKLCYLIFVFYPKFWDLSCCNFFTSPHCPLTLSLPLSSASFSTLDLSMLTHFATRQPDIVFTHHHRIIYWIQFKIS